MNEVVVEAEVVKPLIKEEVLKEVSPIYVWRTGRSYYLSKKEMVVADTFLRTRNYSECARELRKMGVKRDSLTCRRWLSRGHIREYMEEQFEERGICSGWTLEHWMRVMTEHLSGERRLGAGDLYGMSLIAKVRKFETPEVMNITQINFTERA